MNHELLTALGMMSLLCVDPSTVCGTVQLFCCSGCMDKKQCTASNQEFINPLNTKLSCWNFNLVNADQFSRE